MYVSAMSAIDDARKELRTLLEDMNGLKPHADLPGNADAAPFTAAFAAAREKAKAAAQRYVDALKA